jgi:Tat protein translocase TatB subunit
LYLFIFEFLGTNEVLVILVVALMLLGPRRLPEMSRKIGKSLADFKRTSEEFKRTWEKEVDLEGFRGDVESARAMLSPSNSILNPTIERGSVTNVPSDSVEVKDEPVEESIPAPSVTPIDPASMRSGSSEVDDEPMTAVPTRKRDWL